jgi:hypothetical protein
MLYVLKYLGETAVMTDDGAYRRLYHGYGDSGEVSGVSVYICPRLEDGAALATELSNTGVEFLVCVACGRVPQFTTHLLVVTGYDRTFDAGNAHTKDDLAKGAVVNTVESDRVMAPLGLPADNIKEVIASVSPVKSKSVLSVCLKDGLLAHAAKCEEYKALLKHDSSDFVGVLTRVLCPSIVPNSAEITKIFGVKNSIIPAKRKS